MLHTHQMAKCRLQNSIKCEILNFNVLLNVNMLLWPCIIHSLRLCACILPVRWNEHHFQLLLLRKFLRIYLYRKYGTILVFFHRKHQSIDVHTARDRMAPNRVLCIVNAYNAIRTFREGLKKHVLMSFDDILTQIALFLVLPVCTVRRIGVCISNVMYTAICALFLARWAIDGTVLFAGMATYQCFGTFFVATVNKMRRNAIKSKLADWIASVDEKCTYVMCNRPSLHRPQEPLH